MPAASHASLLNAYLEKTPKSRELFQRASGIFPNGVTHVGRFLEPYPVYIDHAAGSRKWDVDGNEYVDYFGGHGALILGHAHPQVLEAVRRQVEKGAHYGASHELEVEWGSLIQQMVPSAERVRFTVTGTEATLLGLRLARAFTGRNKIIRFAGHFHGWHDQVAYTASSSAGVLPGVIADTLIAPPNDLAAVTQLLAEHSDIAAVILEPTGATFGHVPTPPEFVRDLRELTSKRGVLLMFDEVICGFRCSPGGAQGYYGIKPDLTSLAKILAGGFPGAAVVGRADILALLDYRREADMVAPPQVTHQGTYNAGPVSAAAGIATLQVLRETEAIDRANRSAAMIRDGMNEAIRAKGIAWCAYGQFSDFHLYASDGDPVTVDDIYGGRVPPTKLKGGMKTELAHKIRTGMLANGVDIIGWPGGLTSCMHGSDEVDHTVTAFRRVLDGLGEEGALA